MKSILCLPIFSNVFYKFLNAVTFLAKVLANSIKRLFLETQSLFQWFHYSFLPKRLSLKVCIFNCKQKVRNLLVHIHITFHFNLNYVFRFDKNYKKLSFISGNNELVVFLNNHSSGMCTKVKSGMVLKSENMCF